jgi:hypothetical protein
VSRVISDFCDVMLGFKSLMNDFFYVDEETIDRFEIEDEFLVPLFMLADLDEAKYVQPSIPKRWVFTCTLHEPDLNGTGAWNYIDWGGRQAVREKKQAKEVLTIQTALEKQGGKEWWFPKALQHPVQLAVRKGFGDRYAPFVFDTPQVLDQRLYLLEPKKGLDVEVLTAFFVSSLFPLTLETNADLGLGAGVLTLSTTGLRHLPCPDLSAIQSSKGWPTIQSNLKSALKSTPPNAFSIAGDQALQALDGALLDALKVGSTRRQELADAVAMLAHARLDRSKQRKIEKAASSSADLIRTSQPIVEEMRGWLAARSFPQDYLSPGAPTRGLHFPDGEIRVETLYFLGRLHLKVSKVKGGEILNEDFDASVGELILRCLQLGRRVFDVPTSESDAFAVLGKLSLMLDELDKQFRSAIERTSLGSLYEEALTALVLQSLKINLDGLERDIHSATLWTIRE